MSDTVCQPRMSDAKHDVHWLSGGQRKGTSAPRLRGEEAVFGFVCDPGVEDVDDLRLFYAKTLIVVYRMTQENEMVLVLAVEARFVPLGTTQEFFVLPPSYARDIRFRLVEVHPGIRGFCRPCKPRIGLAIRAREEEG